MAEEDTLYTPAYRSKTIRTVEDIDVDALMKDETLDQSFDPWRITERELRYFIGLHVKASGNKYPFITFSRRNRSHVSNHVYCNPNEKYSHREQVRRDERYAIATTGTYEYYVENGERMSLTEVRQRIGSWIKSNCCQTYKTSYNPATHIMTFYNPFWEPNPSKNE